MKLYVAGQEVFTSHQSADCDVFKGTFPIYEMHVQDAYWWSRPKTVWAVHLREGTIQHLFISRHRALECVSRSNYIKEHLLTDNALGPSCCCT
jgi:hypothetical protein